MGYIKHFHILKEQEEFIKSNLSVLDIDDLIEIIESQGYKVI